jgi:hypothetical protein
MRCQYSRCGQVSSEKHATAVEAAAEEEGCPSRGATATLVGGCRALPESFKITTRGVHATHVWRSRSCGRWSVGNTLLDRLIADLRDVMRVCRPSSLYATGVDP